MKKKNRFSCLFGYNIISNVLYQAIRNNTVAEKTTKLVLFFHKNIQASFSLAQYGPIMRQNVKRLDLIEKVFISARKAGKKQN